ARSRTRTPTRAPVAERRGRETRVGDRRRHADPPLHRDGAAAARQRSSVRRLTPTVCATWAALGWHVAGTWSGMAKPQITSEPKPPFPDKKLDKPGLEA